VFIGHFAAGFAAKTVAPRASLGTYVGAAVFLDVLWPVFVLLGIETFRIDPGNTAWTPFDFISYPWSHSLAMAILWSAVFGGAHFAIRKDAATAKVLAAVVFSHWVLDWVTHRPDLQLMPGLATRTGLGLWNFVHGTVAVEGALFAGAVWMYARGSQPLDKTGTYAWAAMVFVLAALYVSTAGPPPKVGQETLVAVMGLLLGAVFIPWAASVDRHRVTT